MANLSDCLGAAVATGKITQDEAELVAIVADHEAARISQKGGISYDDAYQQASNKAIDDFFEGKEIVKRQKVLQIRKVEQALSKAKTHPDGLYTGVMSLLVNDITGKSNYGNVDQLTNVIRGQAHSRMADMLEAYRPRNAGFSTNAEGARQIILETFGHDTKSPDAKFFSDSWKQVSEEMRQRFNLAGGAIKKRKDWGMPQSHDVAKLSGNGYEQWLEDISPMLDWEAMRAQYMKNIEADVLGESSIKQAAREQKAKLNDQYTELGAREQELLSITKQKEQFAAADPRIIKDAVEELRAVRAERKAIKEKMDTIKVTKAEKLEDLPEDTRQQLQDDLERIRSRFDENTESLLSGELEPELRKTFDAIVTDGISELEPSGMQKQSGKLANRHSAARELLFKDGESFLAYHDKYGRGNVYGNMLSHLDSMAGEIAMLETLGPNPEFTFNYLRDSVVQQNPDLRGVKIEFLNSVYKTASGDIHRAVSSTMADFMSGTRSMLVAAKLGSAFLSAISDLAFIRQTSAFNGMSTTKVLKRSMTYFNPKNTAEKNAAIRAGLIADAWIDKTRAGNRFTEVRGATGTGTGKAASMIGKYADAMAKVSDITMRVSLLAPWTEAGRHAFGMEFMGMLADQVPVKFQDLDKPIKRTFERYGITNEDWNVMRKANVNVMDNAQFLRPDDLADARTLGITTEERNELVSKFMRMILTETDYAVPTPDARVQAITAQGTQRGTFVGEMMRSAMMFKSFPITLISQQFYRIASIQGVQDKGSYIATMFLGTTAMGAAAYQLKEISKGREPIAMNTSKFWAAAVQQGGGLGIFGDFLFSDVNRYGQGIGGTIVGPVMPLIDDVAKLTIGNVHEFIGQEGNIEQKWAAMNLSGDVIRASKQYMPGASLWYTRTAFERLVMEQAQMAADPQAKKKFIRLMKKRKAEYNQEYWWEPGVN